MSQFAILKYDPCKPIKEVLCTWDTNSEEYDTPLLQLHQPDDLIGHTFLTTLLKDTQMLLCPHYMMH